MKVLFLKGLPASGKSTWAKEFCQKNTDWVRVNRDDLRHMRGLYWLPGQEDLITQWERDAVVSALDQGYNVIVDATNLNKGYIVSFRDYVKSNLSFPDGLTFEEKFFDVDVEECIKRDARRPEPVGEKVIRGMYEKYLASPPATYKENRNLPHAVLVDIDGTVAKNKTGRGFYDWMRVGEDDVNEHVAELVKTLHTQTGYQIIFMSGRDEVCREITEQWLFNNGFPNDRLFMRPKGNNEKDSIIKKRLFEENIRGKYYIEFVIDDRRQVVDMWRRELGLTCLQCDYGDF